MKVPAMSAFRRIGVAAAECFVREECGQDLVEYSLLAAFVATAGLLVLINLNSDIASVYSSWLDPSAGVPSLWDPQTSVPAAS